MNPRSPLRFLLSLFLILSTLSLGLIGSPASAEGNAPTAAGKQSPKRAAGPGELEVTISTSDSGLVYGELYLYQWQPDGEYFDYYDYQYFEDVSSPAVSTSALPAGSYYGQFYDYSGAYSTAFLDGATEPAIDLSSPGVVTVSPDHGTDATISLAPKPSVEVSGLVTDTADVPLEDVYVWADQTAGPEYDYDETYTAADGTYTLNLAPGTYDLYFNDAYDLHEGASTTIEVADAPVTVPTVSLAPIGRWTVSGTATDSGGAPVSDTDVVLYRLYDYDDDDVYDDFDYIDDVYTDDGTYSFEGVRGNRTYTVVASAPGYTPTVLGGGGDVLAGTPFTPTTDVTLDPILMTRASTVSGTVSGADGPAGSVYVELMRWDPFDEYFYAEDGFYTGDDGAYSLTIPAAGDYTLYFDASDSDASVDSAWLVGSTAPSGPGAPGTFVVSGTPTDFVFDRTLPRPSLATGTVLDQAGNGIPDASVVAYVQYLEDNGDGTTSSYWDQHSTATTDPDGSYRVRVPADAVVTFRFARGGFQPQFLGGGNTLPSEATPGNSRTVPSSGDLAVGSVTLAPFVSQLGKVAGQVLPYCLTNVVPANDDGSSEAVDIPFDLTFFGDDYEQLWVNNNGNVTFNGPTGQFTPSDLTGATDQPIIAPFFADVDTRGEGSNVVTYGTSPDGNTLCVNWADVGYFSSQDDKLNTFQLLLTRNDSSSGRVPGDFDITMNYDEILWETGSASGGNGGYGGTSAAVGFSAGTGAPGTFIQLPGSFDNGALLDGGANSLVAGSQGSSQVGRYVFQVRNDGVQPSLGSLAGTVLDESSNPIGDAYVQVCRTNGTGCSYTYTNNAGHYSFTAISGGAYAVRVYPPTANLFGNGATVTVIGGETTTVDPIVLSAPRPIPDNVVLTNNGIGSNGVPSVYYGDPLEFRVTGCSGVSAPTYTVTLASGQVIRDHLPMTESPAGTYSATIAPLVPSTGDATISTNIPGTCDGALVSFNVYIDPSGIVTDQYGRPIEGATVTLSRSDTINGTYTVVPDGSDIMSPSNRNNPSITDDIGFFQWDVTAGFYKVLAESTGCTPATTPALEVPPERIDLVIKMTCSAAAPVATTAPTITGTPKVGQSITAVDAVWPDPLAGAGVVLRRNGVDLPGTTYQLTAADVDASFTAVATGQRPDYVTEAGTGETVTFSSASQTSAPVIGLLGDPATAPAPAAPTGSGKVGTTLTAVDPVWSLSGVATAREWLRDGSPIAGESGATYAVVPADVGKAITVRYSGSKPGHATGQVVSAAANGLLGDPPTAAAPAAPSGSGKVGTVLTAAANPTWSLAGVTTTLQWLRDGTAIAGADQASYQLVPADLGKAISVDYIGTVTGYEVGHRTSGAVTASLGDGAMSVASPSISGTPAVGSTLTATPGVWAVDGLTFAYQWQRNGSDIDDATSATYPVSVADVASSLTVRVTASRPGYADGADTSSAVQVAKVKSSTTAKLAAKKVSAKKKAKVSVTVKAPGISNPVGAIKIYDGKKVVGKGQLKETSKGKAVITLKKLAKGKHKLVAKYLGSSTTEASISKKVTLKVTKR